MREKQNCAVETKWKTNKLSVIYRVRMSFYVKLIRNTCINESRKSYFEKQNRIAYQSHSVAS